MSKPRAKMPPSERAKQFMPFAALKGLPEALAAKEKIYVQKKELSNDAADELDRKLRLVEKGKIVTVEYFCEGEYLQMTGMAVKIDQNEEYLQIVETKIDISDILDIKFDG